MRLLFDKGWGKTGDENAEQLLTAEWEKTWELIKELVGDMSVFHTFLYDIDYHNLKAAIKQVYKGVEVRNIYLSNGTIAPEEIYEAVKNKDFNRLPDYMRDCARQAYEVQLHTKDSQLCDAIIDKAALDVIYKKGKETGNDLLSLYAELKVAACDLKIVVRSMKTGKDKSFLERSLAECETLDKGKLISAALNGEEAVYEYLAMTDYSEAVLALKESPSAFERWCDNLIIRNIRPQKYNSFSLSPLAAYILARDNEIRTLRIILSGKKNDISETSIRERLREMYV